MPLQCKPFDPAADIHPPVAATVPWVKPDGAPCDPWRVPWAPHLLYRPDPRPRSRSRSRSRPCPQPRPRRHQSPAESSLLGRDNRARSAGDAGTRLLRGAQVRTHHTEPAPASADGATARQLQESLRVPQVLGLRAPIAPPAPKQGHTAGWVQLLTGTPSRKL